TATAFSSQAVITLAEAAVEQARAKANSTSRMIPGMIGSCAVSALPASRMARLRSIPQSIDGGPEPLSRYCNRCPRSAGFAWLRGGNAFLGARHDDVAAGPPQQALLSAGYLPSSGTPSREQATKPRALYSARSTPQRASLAGEG